MASPRAESPEGRPSRFDLGVLLVHGIGESRRGDTLTAWTHALVRCIECWLGGVGVGAEVVQARLGESATSPDEPPRAEVRIGPLPDEKAGLSSRGWDSALRWLAAESWWADSFPVPSYGALARWSFAVLPWTIVSHFDRRFRRAIFRARRPSSAPRKLYDWGRCGVEMVRFLAGVAALPLLLALMVAVLVLGLVPGPLRSLALWIQRLLSAYVGDSFMLVGNEVAPASIHDRVRSDLEWLASRCTRVAVVAHSQGAAIAHEVLRRHPAARCDLLLTFGSGLRKLSEIRQAEESRARLPLLLTVTGVWLSGLAVAAVLLAPLDPWARGAAGLLALLLLAATLGSAEWWRSRTSRSTTAERQYVLDRKIFDERFRLPRAGTRWVDVWTAADVVPNGPLLDDLLPDAMESHEVENRGSAISDHTTYMTAADQFVWGTVDRLLRLSGMEPEDLGAADGGDASPLPGTRAQRVAAARRSWRVRWRVLLGRLVGVAALALAVLWRDEPPARVAAALATVHRWMGSVPVLGEALSGGAPRGTLSVAGLALISATALAVYSLGAGIWSWWDSAEASRAVRGRHARWWEIPGLLTILFWLAVCEAALRLVLPQGLAAVPVPWSLSVLAVVLLASWLFHGFGRVGLGEYLRSLVAAGSPEKVFALWARVERRRLEREAEAGDVAAWVELGWRLEREAGSARSEPAERAEALAEAEALYARAADAGHPRAAWLLGSLREERLATFLGETRDERAGATPVGAASASAGAVDPTRLRERELRGAVASAFRRGVELGDPDSRVWLARTLRDAGDEGRDEAERILAEGVESGEAESALELARTLRERGRPREAREMLERAVELGAPPPHFELGCLAEGVGEIDEAISRYRRALAEGVASAAEPLAGLLERGGRVEEAIAALERGIELGDAEAARRLGRLHRRQGDVEEARAVLELAVRLASGPAARAQAAEDLAHLLRSEGRAEEAEAVLAGAVEKLRSARAALELGRLRRGRGDVAGARSAFDDAYSLARSQADPWLASWAARELARSTGGDAAVERLAELVGELHSVAAAAELGDLLRQRGDEAGARDAFAKALELARRGARSGDRDGDLAGARAAGHLAALLAEEGRGDRASEVLRTAAAELGAAGALELGRFLAERGDWRGAVSAHRRALDRARRDGGGSWMAVGAVVELAEAYSAGGRLGRAERLLEAATVALEAPEAALELGRFLAECEDVEGAAAAYRRAFHLAGGSGGYRASAIRELAELHLRAGEVERAEELLVEAVEPLGAEIALALGRLRAVHGSTEGALAAHRRAAELARAEGDDFLAEEAARRSVELLRARNEPEEAEAVLAESLEASPSARAAVELAELRVELGRRGAAIEAYRRAIELAGAASEPDLGASASIALAELHRERGESERAEEVLARAAETFRSADAALELGRLRSRHGRRAEAVAAHRLALDLARAEGSGWTVERAATELAERLVEEGVPEGAEEVLAPLAVPDGDSLEAAVRLGRIVARRGGDEDALRVLDAVLQHPRAAEHRWSMAEAAEEALAIHQRHGDRAAVERVVALVGEKLGAEGLLDVGRSCRLRGDDASALVALRAAFASSGRDDQKDDRSRAAVEVAEVLRRGGRREEAVELLSAAREELATSDVALALGRLHAAEGRRDRALADLERAVELARREGRSREGGRAAAELARLHREGGKPARAIEVLESALVGLPSAEAALALGEARREAGREEEALAAYRRAFDLARSAGDAWHAARAAQALAVLHAERGELDEAESRLSTVVEELESASAGLDAGQLAVVLERPELALRAYRRTLALARERDSTWAAEEACLALASLAERRGEPERAMKCLWFAAGRFGSARAAEELARVLEGVERPEAAAAWRRRAAALAGRASGG